MSVVWIVEKAKSPGASAAAALMGDYAVRVFASLGSLEKLLRINRQAHPDVLLVDVSDVGWTEDRIADFAQCHFLETPVVLLRGGAAAPLPEGAYVYQLPLDGLKLSLLIAFVVRARRGRRSVIRYRDVMLDFERLQCLVMPGDEAWSLPLKEAQLLKLLLERPGICMSRDEIQDALWTGVKITPRTIDSHVSRLRKRLKGAGVAIESVYGGGYVLR